ncbi:MAG TPA: GNAT family N-acetyltransferase [Caldilineae bacterium]|nr:GNAT family N-acetyltransferase [Caldilineae bacterium]
MPAKIPVQIRPMTLEDVPALARFIAETPLWQRYRVSEEGARRTLERGLSRGEGLYVAVVDGQVAGFIWFLVQGAFAHSGYIRLIGVLPAFSGQGIGARLMAAAEAVIRREAHSVFLLTSDFNEAAQAFYRRLGYQQVGAIPDYILPGVAELIFYKRLW